MGCGASKNVDSTNTAGGAVAKSAEGGDKNGELTLFNFPLSNCGNLVKWFLTYNNIPFKEVVVVIPEKEHRNEKFLKEHPFGKLPILQDTSQGEGWEIVESFAIMRYLAEKYPTPLLPVKSAAANGKVNEALEIIHHDTWLHANHGQWHVVTEPLVYGTTPDMDVVGKEHAALMESLKQLEGFYFKDSPDHMVGKTDTAADFALATCLALNQAWAFNRAGVDLTQVPKVKAFFERTKATEHFQKVFAPVDDFLVNVIAKGDASHPGGVPGLKLKATADKDEGADNKDGDKNGELTLFNFPLSNCGNLVKWFLTYNNIPFKEVVVVIPEKEHRNEKFLKEHPFGKLPILQDTSQGEGWEIVESQAILQYLAHKYSSALLPAKSAAANGKVNEALEIIHHDTWLHANHGQWHVVTEPLVYGTTPDMDVVGKEHAALMESLKQLEGFYFKDSPDHMVGKTDTAADFALATCLALNQAWAFNRAGVDLTQVPKVKAFFERTKATEHFQKVFAPVDDFLVNVIAKGDASHPGGAPGLKA